jgi:hypothetical protein
MRGIHVPIPEIAARAMIGCENDHARAVGWGDKKSVDEVADALLQPCELVHISAFVFFLGPVPADVDGVDIAETI